MVILPMKVALYLEIGSGLMRFNDFVRASLSNDIICIMDDVADNNGKIIEEPRAAYRWIDSCYSNREIDRFTMIPRTDKVNGKMIAVSFK